MSALGKFDRLYDHERKFQAMRDAAPELYEALRVCVRICGKELGKPMNLVGKTPLDIANEALAKASGDIPSGRSQ